MKVKSNIRKFAGYSMALALVATAMLFGMTRSASAEKFKGLNISPTTTTINLKRGEVKTGTVNVRNTTDSDMPVKISVGGYTIKDDNYGAPDYDSTGSKYNEIKNWIKIDETTFTLKSDESRDVRYAIFTPNNPPAGSQYASILISTDYEEQEGINSVGRMAFPIKANMVDGETNENASIISHKIEGYQPESPLKASFRVKNDGNVGAGVKYSMRVTNAFGGKEVAKVDGQESGYDIYPETSRSFAVESKKLGIGFYNVELTVELNGKAETFKQFVVSVPIWIFILIGIAIICLVIYFVTRNQDNKKSSSKSKKTTRKSSKK